MMAVCQAFCPASARVRATGGTRNELHSARGTFRRVAERWRSLLGKQERWWHWRVWEQAPQGGGRCALSASSSRRWVDRAGWRAGEDLAGQYLDDEDGYQGWKEIQEPDRIEAHETSQSPKTDWQTDKDHGDPDNSQIPTPVHPPSIDLTP